MTAAESDPSMVCPEEDDPREIHNTEAAGLDGQKNYPLSMFL